VEASGRGGAFSDPTEGPTGIDVEGPDWEPVAPGRNRWSVILRNETNRTLKGQARIEISGPYGFSLVRRASVSLRPGKQRRIRWTGHLVERGVHGATFFWEGEDGSRYVSSPRKLILPQPLEILVTRPAYRGALYEADPVREMDVRVFVSPIRKRGKRYNLEVTVEQPGAWRVTLDRVRVDSGVMDMTISLPAFPTEPVHVEASLDWARGQAQQRVVIPWIQRREPQVVVGADLSLLRDGKALLPMGVGHVPMDRFKDVFGMGFQSVWGYGSDPSRAQRVLDRALEQDMTVVLDCSDFLRKDPPDLEGLVGWVTQWRDHPALLAWHMSDEPREATLALCREALERIMEIDPHHPVCLTVGVPCMVAWASEVTDILVVDGCSSPASNPNLEIWRQIESWAGTGHGKPVWVTPRGATLQERQCATILGLIHGARGILLPSWDQAVRDSEWNSGVEDLSSFFLAGVRSTPDASLRSSSNPPIWARFDLGERFLLLAANPSPEEGMLTWEDLPNLAQRLGDGCMERQEDGARLRLPPWGTWAGEGRY